MGGEKNDGGPAFPATCRIAVNGVNPATGEPMPVEIDHAFMGMTLRDYFAAKAMQGICANPEVNVSMDAKVPNADVLAVKVYIIADAMLKAR